MKFPLLVFAVLLAATGFAAADDDAPSTDGWGYAVDVLGNNVTVNLNIDNAAALLNYDGLVSKKWTNITLANGAVIEELVLGLDGDPVVVLNFAVLAGNSNTLFTINSAGLPFPAILGEGTATSAVTVTDNDGNGATGTGALGGSFYSASYNGGTNFWTGLVGPVVAPMWSSNTGNGNIPPWQAMGSVNQMAAQWSFTLSAGDGASGTSSYVVRQVVPEPSSFAALAAGAFGLCGALIRRRRS